MVVGQMVAWSWLYDKAGPLREPLHRWLAVDERREENVIANGHPVGAWSMWILVALHHGLGGLLAAIGSLTGSVWLFRFGLSFEIGEDYLHYLQMVWTFFLGKHTELFSDLCTEPAFAIALACHHAVGAVGGTFVFVVVPANQQAQYCVVLLLLSAVPQLFQFPFMPFENLKGEHVSCVGKVAAAMTIGGSLFAFVARMFLFPPGAFELADQMRPLYGDFTANALLTSAALFMVFAVASLWFSAKEMWGALKNLFAVARTEGPGAALRKVAEQGPIVLAATEASFILAPSIKSEREVGIMLAERRASRESHASTPRATVTQEAKV